MKQVKAFNPQGENGVFLETGKSNVIVTGINIYSGKAVEYIVKGIKTLMDAKKFIEFYTCGAVEVQYFFGCEKEV